MDSLYEYAKDAALRVFVGPSFSEIEEWLRGWGITRRLWAAVGAEVQSSLHRTQQACMDLGGGAREDQGRQDLGVSVKEARA